MPPLLPRRQQAPPPCPRPGLPSPGPTRPPAAEPAPCALGWPLDASEPQCPYLQTHALALALAPSASFSINMKSMVSASVVVSARDVLPPEAALHLHGLRTQRGSPPPPDVPALDPARAGPGRSRTHPGSEHSAEAGQAVRLRPSRFHLPPAQMHTHTGPKARLRVGAHPTAAPGRSVSSRVQTPSGTCAGPGAGHPGPEWPEPWSSGGGECAQSGAPLAPQWDRGRAPAV